VTRVVWTRPALADVREIRAHIAQDSPRYGRVVAERLLAAAERLESYPLSGRVVPELGQPTLREVLMGDYRIVYRVTADAVQVVTVVHGARLLPRDRVGPVDAAG
jgi:toxin ParE1/3/4